MRKLPGILLVSTLGCLIAACTGAVGGPVPEGTPENPEEDTGEVVDPGDPDAGGGPTDSGTPGKDSGTPSTDSGSSPTDTGTPPPPPDPGPSGLPVMTNLAIKEVAFFQGVKVSVARDGAKTTSVAPVVAGREALVRVYVEPMAGWSAREVQGELALVSSSGTMHYTATLTPSAASTDASLGSTLNFNVPAGILAKDTTYSVVLQSKAGAPPAGDTSKARYPATGTEALGAKSTGETLKVKIVPIQYGADGSNRLPDTSPTQLEAYRRAFYTMYPAKQVEITVRAAYPYASAISANGSGFSNALNAMVKLRQTDGAPKDVYYYGAFAAASSFSSYCAGGCVTGLCGLLSSPSDSVGRACVGVGFTGAQSAGTAAHEIGHAHGREHAPCGTSGDAKYPYSGGSIGAWGYDLVGKKLLSPSGTKDFMSYCDPTWISDYTYAALATRMSLVNGAAMMFGTTTPPTKYRFVNVGAGATLSWGETMTLTDQPFGAPRDVVFDLGDGTTQTVTGYYYPYADLDGGYLLVPEPAKRYASVRVRDVLPSVDAHLAAPVAWAE